MNEGVVGCTDVSAYFTLLQYESSKINYKQALEQAPRKKKAVVSIELIQARALLWVNFVHFFSMWVTLGRRLRPT